MAPPGTGKRQAMRVGGRSSGRMDTARIAFAPSLALLGVPSSPIMAASRPVIRGSRPVTALRIAA